MCGFASVLLAVAFIGAPRIGERALDIIDAAVSAYSPEHIGRFLSVTEREGVSDHGFPRLTANLATLVADGRRVGDRGLLKRMMSVACREAAKGKTKAGGGGGNEFSVRELVLAIVALEKAGAYPKEVTDGWRADIMKVEAERCYSRGQIPVGANRAHNFCLFGAASEQTRIRYGMGGDPAFVERYVVDQLRWFDENGMYRDPKEPIVYDLVSRQLYGLILDHGYAGAGRARVEEMMEKSSDLTLAMLSATGEIPYGGRSNQFLHNHTLYAAVATWYAKHYAAHGDWKRSAEFAEHATRAMDALEAWLGMKPVRHVKNRYPWATPEFGCERYAHFDKYMVTMGSWAFSIRQFTAGEDEAPSVMEMSRVFHQVLMAAGEYSAQIDYAANDHYDCSGMGRLQRRGAPSAICLSVPCPKGGDIGYRVEATNETVLAIGPEGEDALELVEKTQTSDAATTKWRAGEKEWICRLTREGLMMTLEGNGEVAMALPAFEFDGAEKTEIACDGRRLTVRYRGFVCTYAAERGEIADSGKVCCNRNGRYRRFVVRGRNSAVVRVNIEKEVVK